MKGDIIDFNNVDKFMNLKPGSVVKVIAVRNEIVPTDVGCYLVRIQRSINNNKVAVCILAEEQDDLGTLWGEELHDYKFEIIKEV